jgi:hypothetical protein
MVTDFSKPHYVALTLVFEKKGKGPGHCADDLALHQSYYCSLKKRNRVLLYGKTLNGPGLHIILYVASDDQLARIIESDPLLKTEMLIIKSITPFSTC